MAELPGRKLDDRPPAESDGAPRLDPAAVLGTWTAALRDGDGVVRIDLSTDGDGGVRVRAWGAGETPEAPLDWGEVPAELFAATVAGGPAAGFTARYDLDFLEVLLTAYFKGGLLVLDTFNRFLDGSGRPPYFTREFYHR